MHISANLLYAPSMAQTLSLRNLNNQLRTTHPPEQLVQPSIDSPQALSHDARLRTGLDGALGQVPPQPRSDPVSELLQPLPFHRRWKHKYRVYPVRDIRVRRNHGGRRNLGCIRLVPF